MTDGSMHSPSIGLLHELSHAYGYLFNKKAYTERSNYKYSSYDSDAKYDNAEEKFVIDNIETPAAEKLGEGTRKDHRGKNYETQGPTTIKKPGE